jgi:outer membrane protein assembly factor BamB
MSSLCRALTVLTGVALAGTLLAWLPLTADAQVQVQFKAVARPVPMGAAQPPKEGEFTDALSLPTDRKAKKSLESAEDLIKEEDWTKATYVLQSLLNSKQDLFVEIKRVDADDKESKQWTSIRLEANRLLGTLPPKGLEVYELQFGGKARELLSEAKKLPEQRGSEELRQKSSAEILATVAQSYLHTKAGAEAANLLGTHLLDRGQPVVAALCFERLLAKPANEGKTSPLTLLKAAVAFRRTGDAAGAARAWERLVKASPAGVDLGGRVVPLDELKKELDRVPDETVAVSQYDWTMVNGSPSRSAHGKGGTPFLDEVSWTQPMSENDETIHLVAQAADHEVKRARNAVLPGFFPIAAGGKLIFRSYSGVQAADLRTGKLAWEQPANWSLEKLISDSRKKFALKQWMGMYTGGGNQHIIYENSTVGTLSTDNSLVYAVDDLALPPHPAFMQQFQWGGQPSFMELNDAVHHSELMAIELETGKLKWQVGGRGEKGELNDCFFLGPPLPLGGKLYAMVEKNSELRLVCLAAATGELQWAQTLAAVRDRLTGDVGRRVHAAHLAYGDGILVCPTNAGAILGVDLLTHSLVWAKPYREGTPPAPEQQFPNGMVRFGGGRGVMVMPQYNQHLSPDWKSSTPVVRDGKVVFTAPDGSSIYCLNLRDGGTVWKVNRSDDLYLAGVYHGKVLLVGKQNCRALDLADGKQLWARETGVPSGYGVAGEKLYYLPLRASADDKEPEVCAINIDTGKIEAHSKMRKEAVAGSEKREAPGNLIFYDGKVISQTVSRVVAYPQLEVKEAEMNARIAKNPDDPRGLVERAEIRRHNGKVALAVEDLRRAIANKPDAPLLPKARQLLFESLTELFKEDFNASEKYLDEYKEMCKVTVPDRASAEERQKLLDEGQRREANFLYLVAKGKEEQGKLPEAFHYYTEFGRLKDKTGLLTVLDEVTVKAAPQVWAQGRIAAMIAKAKPEQRRPLEDEIARQWQEVRKANDLARLRDFVDVFGSLSAAGNEARLRLAERLMESGAFIDAELQLLQVCRQDERQLAGRAVELLARLCTRHGLMEDAAHWYQVLGRDYGPVLIRDGKTGADLLDDLATDKRFLPFLDEPRPVWENGKIKAREVHNQSHPTQQTFYFDPEGPDDLPFFRKYRLAVNTAPGKIRLIDRSSNEDRWSLDAQQNLGHLQYLSVNQQLGLPQSRHSYQVQGHVAVVSLGTKVYGLDLTEPKGKILWQRSLLEGEALQPSTVEVNAQGGLQVMYPDQRRERIGGAGPFEPAAASLLTRQGLSALDPVTGTVLWSRTDVPAGTQLFGDGQQVYLADVRSDGGTGAGRAVRTRDGAGVAVRDFADLYQRRVRTFGRYLLVSETVSRPAGLRLRLYDVAAGKDVWKQDFSAGAIVLQSEEPDLAAVAEPNRDGRLTVIDLRTRQEVLHATLDKGELLKGQQSVHLLRDKNLVYVAMNAANNPQMNPIGGPWVNVTTGIRGLPVNGTFYAFDAKTGKLRWKSDLPNQALLLEQYRELPILIFSSRSQQFGNQFGNIGMQPFTSTKSIAKRTGKLVYDNQSRLDNRNQFYALQVDLKNRTIDLISYGMRVQHYLEPNVEQVQK